VPNENATAANIAPEAFRKLKQRTGNSTLYRKEIRRGKRSVGLTHAPCHQHREIATQFRASLYERLESRPAHENKLGIAQCSDRCGTHTPIDHRQLADHRAWTKYG